MKPLPSLRTSKLVFPGVPRKILANVLSTTTKTEKARADKIILKEDTGLIPLAKAHYLTESTGSKAARLGELIEAGYNVPDGFVFTSEIINRTRAQTDTPLLNSAEMQNVDRLWKKLRTEKVAVRRSGFYNEGKNSDSTGAYETILNVSRDDLESTVEKVYHSFRTAAHTHCPTTHRADAEPGRGGGVVVQKMESAEFSGVMFTEHPGTTGTMIVELVNGLGTDLVTGSVTPLTCVFGKLSGEILEDDSSNAVAPLALDPLLILGLELEAKFGRPQAIEWTYANGKFYLLQARDITHSIGDGCSLKNLAEHERRKLLQNLLSERRQVRKIQLFDPDEIAYEKTGITELLPRPTPLSADFMQRAWSEGGSRELACRDLGVPYTVCNGSVPYINTVFGWTYINKHEEIKRMGTGPGAVTSYRLVKNVENTFDHFHEEFLPQFKTDMIERDTIAMESLSLEEAISLFRSWTKRFIVETGFVAERINISAEIHLKSALDKLKAVSLELTQYLNVHEDTVVSSAMSLLAGDSISEEAIEQFVLSFGHRAPLDYELAQPRFAEDMNLVQQHIERSKQNSSKLLVEPLAKLDNHKALQRRVKRARDFMRLKEEARHHCLIELAQIRKLLLCIDHKLQLDGRIFQLTIDEVIKLADPDTHPQLMRTADQRLEATMAWKALQLPAALSIRDLERMDLLTGALPYVARKGKLAGKRVAGEKEVVGTVRVITDADQIHTLKPGEILVTRMIDPEWYPLYVEMRGIITQGGGWLSNAAIVAREFDLPTIVGVNNACKRLRTGDVVRMTLAGAVEVMFNRRESNPPLRNCNSEAANNLHMHSQAEDAHQQNNPYQLTAHKLFAYSQNLDRRAMKLRATDRRSALRLKDQGEIQLDRRLANRLENAETPRKAG